MSKKAKNRVLLDFNYYKQNQPTGITCRIHDENIFIWDACILGPDDTPWEGGCFFLRIEIPDTYPDTVPFIRFTSRMFHPNIYNDGKICLDILQNRWTPQYNIVTVLLSIQSLLNDPNPSSPANQYASSLYCNHKEEYNEKVRECVLRSLLCEEAAAMYLNENSNDSNV